MIAAADHFRGVTKMVVDVVMDDKNVREPERIYP